VYFSKSFVSARCAFLILQNIHNKEVMYQNLHNKGLNGKNERFRPVFVGKIVQIKELLLAKRAKPRVSRGFLCSSSILLNGPKLMDRFFIEL
jgi:hypothetical protein